MDSGNTGSFPLNKIVSFLDWAKKKLQTVATKRLLHRCKVAGHSGKVETGGCSRGPQSDLIRSCLMRELEQDIFTRQSCLLMNSQHAQLKIDCQSNYNELHPSKTTKANGPTIFRTVQDCNVDQLSLCMNLESRLQSCIAHCFHYWIVFGEEFKHPQEN